MNHSTQIALVFVSICILLSPLALAQPGPGRFRGGPNYDPGQELTLTGTVQEVLEVEGSWHWKGLHLRLLVEETSYEIHLGPAAFVAEQGFELAAGDVVTVIASPMAGAEEKTELIARQIEKGDETLVLRNEQGIPAWSRGRE